MTEIEALQSIAASLKGIQFTLFIVALVVGLGTWMK